MLTNDDNWPVVRSERVWGLPEGRENLIKRLKRGDYLFIYLTSSRRGKELLPPRLAGLFEVSSDPYRDPSRLFKDRSYPNRVRLEPLIVPEEPMEFKPLIQKLEFLKNKRFWSAHLRSGLVRISERDFELLKSALEGAVK
ncbi:MAG: EVE domain-containing protein [Candidatus Korarchaeum sp.]